MLFDLLSSAKNNIARKKLRSFLTIIGVTIGVASVITIGNISQCGTYAINSELDSLGLGSLMISSTLEGKFKLTETELALIKNMKQVKEAMPILIDNAQVCTEKENSNSLILGIGENANRIVSFNTLYGRDIKSRDLKSCDNVCMVDQSFAKKMYGRDNVIGKEISIATNAENERYKIVGVVKAEGGFLSNCVGESIPSFVYVPYTTMQKGTNKAFNQIAIKAAEKGSIDKVGRIIETKLNNICGEKGAYKASNLMKQRETLLNMLNIVTVILSIIGGISLFVANISIMTVMLVSVSERTREIGIKKSIGANRKVIMVEFLSEAFLLTATGCVIGIVIGMGLSYTGAALFNIPFKLKGDILLIAVLFSIVTGIIFGVYPAYKAANLKPIDALRKE